MLISRTKTQPDSAAIHLVSLSFRNSETDALSRRLSLRSHGRSGMRRASAEKGVVVPLFLYRRRRAVTGQEFHNGG